MSRLFDASTEVLNIDSALVTAYPFTVSAWFKSVNNTNIQTIFIVCDKDVNTNNQWRLQLRGDAAGDPIRVVSRTTSQVDADTTTGYSINVWQHACGVFASATSRSAYLNGGSKGSNTTSNTPINLDRTSIGLSNDSIPDSPFLGQIAEVCVWNVELTDAEVAYLANRVSALRIRPSNIIAYWPLYGDSSPEVDMSGKLINLTVTGATQADHPPIAPPFGYDVGWMGAYTVPSGGGLNIPVAMHHLRQMVG